MFKRHMSNSPQCSSQTTRYNRAHGAARPERLPILSMRNVIGVLNAVEIQIETGGDSPAVNGLLRAAVRHQVDESAALEVFRAIDQFEQTEAQPRRRPGRQAVSEGRR